MTTPGHSACRSTVIANGGYDGDVLFENLELIRTVLASGGRIAAPRDCYVRRLPPSTAHFVGQRTRQAYDDFAIPARMALWLSIVPGLAVAATRGRFRVTSCGMAAACVAAAELGRRRADGTAVFPPASSLLAPGWVLERGVRLARGAPAAAPWRCALWRQRDPGRRSLDEAAATPLAHRRRRASHSSGCGSALDHSSSAAVSALDHSSRPPSTVFLRPRELCDAPAEVGCLTGRVNLDDIARAGDVVGDFDD